MTVLPGFNCLTCTASKARHVSAYHVYQQILDSPSIFISFNNTRNTKTYLLSISSFNSYCPVRDRKFLLPGRNLKWHAVTYLGIFQI